jgi:hypothetical protein
MNLGTLYVNLNADSKSFFSTMEGASQRIEKFAKETKKLANDVAQTSGMLLGLGAAALGLAATVDGPTARSMDNLKKSTQLLAVQVADVLQPAVQQLTSWFHTAADAVAGMDPELKKQIATWATWAAGIAVAAKAIGTVAALIDGVAGALGAAFAAVAAVGIGPIMAFVAAIALAAAGVAALHYAWRTNLGGIADGWKKFSDWFSSTASAAFEGAAKFATKFADSFLAQLRDLADGAVRFFDLIGNGEAKKKALTIYQGLESARQGLLKDGLFKSVVTKALDMGKAAGGAFVDEWKRILESSGAMGMIDKFKSAFNGGSAGAARGFGPWTSGAATAQASVDIKRASNQAGHMSGKVDTRAIMDQYQGTLREQAEFNRALDEQRRQELMARKALAAQLEFEAKKGAAFRTGSRAGLSRDQAIEFGVATRKQKEEARREGLGAHGRAEEDSAAAARKWAAVGQVALQGVTGAMGELGNIVNDAASAAASGGPWAAVIAVIMDLVKKTESAAQFMGVAMEFVKEIAKMVEPLVKPIFAALEKVLGTIMSEIAPLFAALQPLAEFFAQSLEDLQPVFTAIGDIVQALAPIIQFVGNLLKIMNEALKPLLDILAGVLKAIATVILGIVVAFNEIAAAFGDTKARAEADRLRALVASMWEPAAADRAEAEHTAATATLRNAAAQNEAAAAATKVAESFSNVPSGYKLALARFTATGPGANQYAGAGGFGGGAGSGGGGNIIVNGDLHINNEDGESAADIVERTRRQTARERAQNRGHEVRDDLD